MVEVELLASWEVFGLGIFRAVARSFWSGLRTPQSIATQSQARSKMQQYDSDSFDMQDSVMYLLLTGNAGRTKPLTIQYSFQRIEKQIWGSRPRICDESSPWRRNKKTSVRVFL
jgi:hypothetical protein